MRRVAFSMTIDPGGAMHDWVDLPPGWSMLRIPTQEAVHLLGPRAYQELLVDVCERERPDLVVAHPPYDHITPRTADRLRSAGARVLGYAFDDEIFAHAYGPSTRAALERVYDRYVTTREVRWATAPLPAVAARPAEHDVVLVGRAYPRRVELIEALRGAGLGVVVRGVGWPEGYATRREMLDLYARAAVVLTTADWEGHAVPMVKHRLLDTAMLGVYQVAQEAPDLRGYFTEEEVPSFGDAGELVVRVREALGDPARRLAAAAAARRRALGEHTWTRRWPQLLEGVTLGNPERAPPPPESRSRLLDQLLLCLASRAEADGRVPAAGALFEELLARDPAEPAAQAGLGRCLRDLGEPEQALRWLELAGHAESSPAAAAIVAALPPCGVGTGLGRLGLLPPATEPLLFQVATLLELDRVAEAAALLDSVESPAVRQQLAASLRLGDDPSFDPIRTRLARWLPG